MKLVTFANKTFCMDEFGYLEEPSMWDEDFAEGIAPSVGIASGMNDDHWRVIRYLRGSMEHGGTIPYFVSACIDLGLKLREFSDLFPTGYMRGACRAAGISFRFILEHNPLLTYEHLPSIWTRYPLSPLGFLEQFEAWDETFVNLVAREWDLPCGLTEAHWQVIRYLRGRFAESREIPLVYETCRACGLDLNELHRLFPTGYRRGACLIAGLPLV